MMEQDFRKIILSQRKDKKKADWNGTLIDYLSLVQENPAIANFAPGRIYNMVMKYGTEDVEPQFKTRGYEDLVRYNFFKGKIFGTYEPIHDLMRFMKAAARRTETGKRILMMVGPVSSGKSTIAALIKRGLIYIAALNCEENTYAIPIDLAEFLLEIIGQDLLEKLEIGP